MRNLLLLVCSVSLSLNTIAQTAEYSSFGGNEKAFNDKYKLTAIMNEAGKKLDVKTTAPITKIILSVYSQQEMAVRKGTDHTQTFTKWPGTFTYDLNSAPYKDKFAYWLKVYTTDGLFTEYIYQKRKKETTIAKPAEEIIKPVPGENDEAGEEIKTNDGGTVIKTTISCKAGSEKVEAALREHEGVFDIKINISTGKLTIYYSSDGTPFKTILQTIRDNGFDANGLKSTKPATNPCKTKPSKD